MRTQLYKLAAVLTLFLFSHGFKSQIGTIDSLRIIPANTTASSVVKVICRSYFSSSGCGLTTSSVSVSGNTITVQASHTLGILTVICNRIDTITLGTFPVGVYLVNYSIHNATNSNMFDNASVTFTVQGSAGIFPQKEISPAFHMYPNPATNELFIKSETDGLIAEVFNVLGERVLEFNLAIGKNKMDISYLPSGTYIVKTSGNQTNAKVQKLVISK